MDELERRDEYTTGVLDGLGAVQILIWRTQASLAGRGEDVSKISVRALLEGIGVIERDIKICRNDVLLELQGLCKGSLNERYEKLQAAASGA